MSQRVLAKLAFDRAHGLWALGDATAALGALARGTPPELADSLVVPSKLGPQAQIPRLIIGVPVLIGSPHQNLILGTAVLYRLGQTGAALSWAMALERSEGLFP